MSYTNLRAESRSDRIRITANHIAKACDSAAQLDYNIRALDLPQDAKETLYAMKLDAKRLLRILEARGI